MAAKKPSFGTASRFWTKLGFINFGGPTGQISIMHTELVDRRGWISEDRFLHALNYCVLLPGPEAQQLAIYVGWLLHKIRGGLVAGVTFVVPSFFLMLGLSWIAAAHGDVTWVAGVFAGLGAAVVGIVAAAGLRMGRKALRSRAHVAVAAFAFAAIFLVGVPFPLIIIGVGVLGVLARRTFAPADSSSKDAEAAAEAHHTHVSWKRTVTVLVVGLAVWWIPLLFVASLDFGTTVFRDEAFFFAKAAVVTFGGAYAVLAYINQAAVLQYGWVTQAQMVTGLGLAESTPGPLIMVTEFVGFLGAYQLHGNLSPVAAGTLGAVVTVWATFAPCFLWIFLGAPYIERLRGNVRISAALGAITAAVVGIIASVAVTFAVNTLFAIVRTRDVAWTVVAVPVLSSVKVPALIVAVVTFVGMHKLKWHVVPIVLGAGAAGLIWSVLGP